MTLLLLFNQHNDSEDSPPSRTKPFHFTARKKTVLADAVLVKEGEPIRPEPSASRRTVSHSTDSYVVKREAPHVVNINAAIINNTFNVNQSKDSKLKKAFPYVAAGISVTGVVHQWKDGIVTGLNFLISWLLSLVH